MFYGGFYMREITLKCYNSYPVVVYIWDEVENPRGVIQLSHGMAEHLARYDEFALFLNSNGYIVLGDDHRGHGKTCGLENIGKTPAGDCFEDTVEDLMIITQYAKDNYNLPITLFGHSYGSFLCQRYIQRASNMINGVILCGSALLNGIDVKAARVIANIQYALFGKDKKGKLLKKLSFGPYEKMFIQENKKFAWGTRDDIIRQAYIDDPLCGRTMYLGFYKGFFKGLSRIYKKANLSAIRKDLPILIVSGDKDPVGGQGKLVTKLNEMYKSIGIVSVFKKLYKDARHELLNETNRQEIYQDILYFISQI